VNIDKHELEMVLYAAYRLGVLDVILNDDVQEALPTPGIFKANFEEEREFRQQIVDRLEVEVKLTLTGS
jgi:hypothetical protein